MVGKRVTNRISVNHFFHFNCPKDIKLALCQMIGQSATGQVQLVSSQKIKKDKVINCLWWWSVNLPLARWNFVPFINHLWCSLKFFPLFAIIKSLWRSCEVQWCNLLRLWPMQTVCKSLSTHYQGHEIYNLSEKELLYKQRISLELLEVKFILSVGFKIWHYLTLPFSKSGHYLALPVLESGHYVALPVLKIRTLLGTWHYLTLHLEGFVSNLPPSGGQQDLSWYLKAQRRDLIWASGRTFSTIVIVINGMIMAMLLEMAE